MTDETTVVGKNTEPQTDSGNKTTNANTGLPDSIRETWWSLVVPYVVITVDPQAYQT